MTSMLSATMCCSNARLPAILCSTLCMFGRPNDTACIYLPCTSADICCIVWFLSKTALKCFAWQLCYKKMNLPVHAAPVMCFWAVIFVPSRAKKVTFLDSVQPWESMLGSSYSQSHLAHTLLPAGAGMLQWGTEESMFSSTCRTYFSTL